MPRPRSPAAGRVGGSVAAAEGDTVRPHASRVRRATRAAAAAIACAAVSLPAPSAAQTTQDRIDQTRAAIEAAAEEWFEIRAEAARLEGRIAELEQLVADALGRAEEAGRVASARAIEIYKDSAHSLPSVFDSDDALDSVRRAELLDRANAESRRAIDDLNAAADDLEALREELAAQRDAQQRAIDDLQVRQETLDAELGALRDEARREEAVRATARTDQTRTDQTRRQAGRAAPRPNAAPAAAPADAPLAPPAAIPAPAGGHPEHDHPFLVCTRERESGGNYEIVSSSGYYGAYQFARTTWDATASRAGRLELVGVPPNRASEYDQDDLAWTLYQWQGNRPWNGRC